jgi:hypothetical protein
MTSFENIASLAMDEIRVASRKTIYQTDFFAWQWDILGHKTYGKMEGIIHETLFGKKVRTVVKSSNGTAKSFSMADIICWWVSVFPPGDSLAIISAPSIPQLEKVVFAYLKNNYNVAMKRGLRMPGWIDEQLNWKYATPAGNDTLAFGRKPPDQDAVSTFQGVRSNVGKTFVLFDEAGGMSREMYTAAEAVMTGSDSRFLGIGNPDNTGTMFHDIFKDSDRYEAEYNRFTISSFDLPTLTGERVYPHTPEGDEMEAKMLSALTSKEWVEHKDRVWGRKDARYQSKVLGEFPSEGGNAFFPQDAIDKAFNNVTITEDANQPVILGVDIARYGQDESVIYSNQGGRVRLVHAWGKCDTYESEQTIHAHAKRLGASEVRVDASGIGGAVFDHLAGLPEFADKTYELFGIDGGARPPDAAQHYNNRAYNHDSLRDQLVKGNIDFDFEDKELKSQLEAVTFKFTQRGATQITPKDELRTEMGGSPDRLDAVIYACVDLDWLNGPQPGDMIDYDIDGPVEGMVFYSMNQFGW